MSVLHSLVCICVCVAPLDFWAFFLCIHSSNTLISFVNVALFSLKQKLFERENAVRHMELVSSEAAAVLRHLFVLTIVFQCVILAVICLVVIFLQWHLAPVSHQRPAETADTALPDIHQHRSKTRRSKNRCQCLAFRDLGRLDRLAPGPASLTNTPGFWPGNGLVSPLSFIYCSGQQDPDESVRPATYTLLRNELKGDEASPAFMLPVRALVSLTGVRVFQVRGMQLYLFDSGNWEFNGVLTTQPNHGR